MTFLQPWYIPLIAAAVALPPLVLLYFLKLKRREIAIASTMLWRRAVQDLQVNSPFQRLRNNLLLILQLLVLLLAILAITEPMRDVKSEFEKNVVLIFDQSASMATVEVDGKTRLDLAKEQAKQIVEDMNAEQRAMVIVFGDRANVAMSLSDDKRELSRVIDSVEQTDEVARLNEAIVLAEAHLSPLGADLTTIADVNMSEYVLLTDGRLNDAAEIRIRRGSLQVVRIGSETQNVGIVSIDASRDYEQPEMVRIIARIRNFGSEPASRDVSLYIDGQMKSIQTTPQLTPLADAQALGKAASDLVPPDGNECVVPFDLILGQGAHVEVRLTGHDALVADDSAFAVIKPPAEMTALLVTEGNFYLQQMVEAMPLDHAHSDVWTSEEYESAAEDQLVDPDTDRCRYDVVIFDGHSTARLPSAGYIFVGAIPLVDGVEMGELLTDRINDVWAADWDDAHPVLRYVELGNRVWLGEWYELKLPEKALHLVESVDGPMISLLHEGRSDYLVMSFSLFDETREHLNTNWAVEDRGFVVFFYNALRYLSGNTGTGSVPAVLPGETFTLMTSPDNESVEIRQPDGESVEVLVRADGAAPFSGTKHVGIYRTSLAAVGEDARAVNLCNDSESLIAPKAEFAIADGEVTTSDVVQRVNQPLWPFVLMALGGLLCVEWFIYNKRMFV